MKSLQEAIQPVLTQPTPADLVALQGALLASGERGDSFDNALETAGQFHAYLCDLQSKISAREYSELASRLDIGAVGAVALESIISADREHLWQGLLLGALGEGLMVAASRQYVKAWEVETVQVHTCAAWHLTEALWRASGEMQPVLSPEKRWEAIQALLAPAYDDEVPGEDKALLLGRVFQILLLTHLAEVMGASGPDDSTTTEEAA
ncbi:hypothetical protein ACFLTC_03305 [Chloroflexota bacterium]